MRVWGIVSLLVLVAVPVPLFAQGGNHSTSSNVSSSGSSNSASGTLTTSVENQSSQGGFIGSGQPSGFVGTDEIYNPTSTSSTSSRATSSRRTVTTARSTTRTTAQRRTSAASGAARSNLGSNNQSVRAVASIDFDVVIPSPQERLVTTQSMDSGFRRIPGLRDGQVTFRTSPAGTTAVLTGTVATERERRVAQQFLLLEPGIDQVENLLEIR